MGISTSGPLGQGAEDPVRLLPAGRVHRHVDVVALHELLSERLERVARHQDVVLADRKGDVHDLVLLLLGDRHPFHRQVLEPDERRELAAEDRLVEVERLLSVPCEVEVRVHLRHV
jgi:hypothetical protein